MRKDILAAGGRKATYAVSGKVDDTVELKNVAPEGSRDESIPVVEVKTEIRKKFIPTKGVLLIRRREATQQSGLLVLDPMEKERPAEGTVLAVGPSSDVTVGSHVVFGKYAGAEYKLNSEVLLLVEESDIKGFIVDEQSTGPTFDDPLALRAETFPGIPRC
jgi:chaperonin GroES